MKTYTLIFIGILSFYASMADAQSSDKLFDSTPRQRASFWTNRMNEKLDLSELQQKQVFNIFLATAFKLDSIRNNCDSASLKIEYIREVLTERELDFKKVLTPEQFKNYLVLKDEQKQKLRKKLRTNSK